MFIYHALISIFFYITSLFSFIIFGALFVIIGFLPNKFIFAYMPIFCRIILLSLGVIIKVHGNFPKGGPFVLMFNHGSFIDPFIYASIIKGKFTGIVATKNYKIPIFGMMLKKFRAIPIHRENQKKAIESIRLAENVIKNEGYHMCILPEGTRTLDGNLKNFKKGGFHMAMNTKTSILPIGAILPFHYKPKNRWTLRPGIINVYFGKPTNICNYEKLGVQGLLDLVENDIRLLIKEERKSL